MRKFILVLLLQMLIFSVTLAFCDELGDKLDLEIAVEVVTGRGGDNEFSDGGL